MRCIPGTVTTLLLLVSLEARAQDASAPGTPSSPHPTFTNLSIDWPLGGDDDADGVVTLRYRAQGETGFREGLPLRRVPAGSNVGFSWANRHAGSIFGLEPGTTYEIELSLSDPDGGDATTMLTATTRALPAEAPGATLKPVTPQTIGAELSAAQPGDVLVLADGTYAQINVGVDGTEASPIVLRAENPGGAVVEGQVRLDGRSHVHVIGLTVHDQIKFNDAVGIVIRGCTIDTAGDGIVSFGSGVSGAYVVDNTITGPTVWNEGSFGVNGQNLGEGIALTGPGNVIAFNRVVGFRDCISLLEDSEAVDQQSIDIYGNDVEQCADDGIEADFAMGNVRVYHNRITNAFMGISSQPSLGGPTYFARNVMFNVVLSAFKLQRSSVGDVGFHNTVVKSGDAFGVFTSDVWSRALFRNNLFLGGPGGVQNGYDTGPGRVMYLPSADASCDFDYDGFGAVGVNGFSGNVGGTTFDGLAQLQAVTSEQHAVEVDLAVFAASVSIPADPASVLAAPELALAEGSAAVDAGLPLANVNDGYAGGAPDLGAYELGASIPVYGPGGTIPGAGGGGGGGTGGAGASGGGSASGGASSVGAGGSGADGASDEEGGCGCRVGGTASPLGATPWWLAFALLLRRRARSSRAQ
ncbi:MAG: right-handed parallel beta-helix repeat-containing protein [Polyangiaceae bacterium]